MSGWANDGTPTSLEGADIDVDLGEQRDYKRDPVARPAIRLTVENLSDPQESSQVWLTAPEARALAAELLRHADLLDSK